MNVLILTPDAVGSTLLQRLITIYMQFHQYDQPVINLHELTNGLVKYYNPTFDQEVLGKKDGKWGYHQSLEQIVELLSTVDHYKTSRLAHYHIKSRQDPIDQQIPFYQYLNENFYIISCRRHNVFEHALSWCLSKITKKLNVYTSNEKITSFFDLYRNGLDIDPNSLIQTLNAYRDYLKWCDDHFNVANYFYYDEHLPEIEKYILSLPIFAQQTQQLTWKDKFDMEFNTWNRCHYINSDIGTLALTAPDKFAQLDNTKFLASDEITFLTNYQTVADPSWPAINSMSDYQNLPEHIRQEVEQQHRVPLPVVADNLSRSVVAPAVLPTLLPTEHQEFLSQHNPIYQKTLTDISTMVNSGIMISAPPIKKQTLSEKKHIIKNYQHLLTVYNQWISANPKVGLPVDDSVLEQFAQIEQARYSPSGSDVQVFAEQKLD